MKPLRSTLARKFIFLLVGFLTLQALQLALGVYGVSHVLDASRVIAEAGQQRLRTLQLAELGRLALGPGDDRAGTREPLSTAITEYDQGFVVIERDLAELGHAQALVAVLGQAREAWHESLRPLLTGIDPGRPGDSRRRLRRYEDLSILQLARLTRVVAGVEQDVRDDSRRFALTQTAMVVLSLLLGTIGLVMARHVLTLPLRRLTDATRSITAGAYGRRVEVRSHDEVGELADTFNRMAQAVSAKTSQLDALHQVAIAITSSLSLNETLDQIMRRGIVLTGSKAACVAFFNSETGAFDEWVTQGLSDRFIRGMEFRRGGLADEAYAAAGADGYILSNDLPGTRHKLSDPAREEGIRCFVCLPLVSHTSRLGVIYFYRADRDTFLADEVELLRMFASLAAQAIENARLHAMVERQAATDSLTGLANRRVFDQRLQDEITRAQRYLRPFSLLLLDVDHFKRINDTYGHVAGDAVLQELAGLLGQQVRDVDAVARYGGEEFAALLTETGDEAAKQIAERIRKAVAGQAFSLPHGGQATLSLSIGIASFPQCADTADTLLERADQALYTAKESGRNRVVLYRVMLKNEIERRPERITELLNESLDNIPAVVTAVEAKAGFSRAHTQQVERVAMLLAQALGLTPQDRETLRLAAALHDVGLVAVPDPVLNKRAPLTDEEQGLVRRHPALSASLLEGVAALAAVVPIVRHHHERHDGRGYPDGLKGEEIPGLARILVVADTYVSLVSEWPGRRPMTPAEARAVLQVEAGHQLDPHVVEILLRTFDTGAA